MKSSNEIKISSTRMTFLREQGYMSQSDADLAQMAFGIRFAYKSCFAVLVVGIATANIPTLVLMNTIAFFGVVLPNHPFDYVYNIFLADRMGRPKLPKRDIRLRFACLVATTWIAAVTWMFLIGNMMLGYILGSSLLVAVISVAFFDFCVPSWVFNLFKRPQTPIME